MLVIMAHTLGVLQCVVQPTSSTPFRRLVSLIMLVIVLVVRVPMPVLPELPPLHPLPLVM
jgi:isoprenylcysteine carboxyl methyltransferase (ICMT) family protein YpbQ